MPNSSPSNSSRVKRKRRGSGTSVREGRPIHERYNVGELELISSDGVIFKVDPIYLCAGSQVFRDMIALSKDAANPVELTDEENEKASIVGIFLDGLHGKPIIEAGCQTATTLKVIALADKYDCTALQRHLQQELRAHLSFETLSAYYIFILLSKLGDVEGCAAAVRLGGQKAWPRPTSSIFEPDNARGLHQQLYNVGWANPTSWPFDDVLKVDLRFYYALARAFKVSNATHPLVTKQLEKIAEEFCRLLDKGMPAVADS